MNYPKGLIRYTTDNLLNNKPSRIVRPRSVVYSLILMILVSGVSYGLLTKDLVEIDILRDRNVLYREVVGGIENIYIARILNKDESDHRFVIAIEGLDDPQIYVDEEQLTVPSGSVSDVTLTVRADVDYSGSRDMIVRIEAVDNPRIVATSTTRFLSGEVSN